MSTQSLYITGIGCLTPFGHDVHDLVAGLVEKRSAIQVSSLPEECRHSQTPLGTMPDFKELLAEYVRPNLRRKMSRLSRMSTLAAGMALKSAGLLDENGDHTGITFGTAFGSTGHSETFFLDYLQHGPSMVNPGLFPETVPNAPAGQISIRYGLKGPNATICQQNLSSELALLQAKEMLDSGMANKMMVVGAEETSPALLKGFDALGILQRVDEFIPHDINLSSRTIPGEAAVALVLETGESVQQRKAKPLASLIDVEVRGQGTWPHKYAADLSNITNSLKKLLARNSVKIDAVVGGGTFIKNVDQAHFAHLYQVIEEAAPFSVPEYATGNLMGAGLLKVLTGVLLLQGNSLPMRSLDKKIPARATLDSFYTEIPPVATHVLTSAVSAGGGTGMVLLAK